MNEFEQKFKMMTPNKGKRFEDLEVWQLARAFSGKVYAFTRRGEFAKDFKFKEQWRASSGSVMDCIAEGYERGGNAEFRNFLFISKGSAGEMRSQTIRASDAGYLNPEEYQDMYNRALTISTKLHNLIKSIDDSDFKGHKYK